MGDTHSKRRPIDTIIETKGDVEYEFLDLECDSETERLKILKLRDEFQNDLQMFLLNQLIFSVTFFNNYETELLELLQHESNKSLKEFNLTDDLFLTCMQPDEVFSLVNKHVYFSPRHGPNKNKKSSLVSNRIYVIHENINIVKDRENDYAHIDKPSLTAQVIEKTRPGYVKLRYIEDMKFKNSISSNSSSTRTSDEASSTGDTDTDSEKYGRITIARTIRPMPFDKNTISKTLYPITEVKIRNHHAENDRDLYIYEYYVDSKNVKEKFHQNWSKVAELLELDEEDVAKAGFNCDSIFCHSSKTKTMWEIIPGVQLPTGAYEEFRDTKNRTKKLILNDRLTFLTNLMLNDIAVMDRLAIPHGFIPKDRHDFNPQYNLEWELAHPKVERYLQNCLSHAHMKALLLLIVIHKSYIEPKTNTQGVTVRHLVTLLFWELQKNVIVSETRMGTRLKQILESFYEFLGNQELPDYFVQQRNHFENIPSPKLRQAQKAFKKTIDAPLLSFMSALLNVKYFNDTHPRLDIKELYKIITKNDAIVLRPEVNIQPKRQVDWNERKRTMIRIQNEKAQAPQQNLETARKESVDSIDYSVNVKTLQAHTLKWYLKARQILKFFLDHYLKMAATCHKWKNSHQSQAYIKQAKCLINLFNQSCSTDANEYNKKIAELIQEFEEEDILRRETMSGPTLPRRTSSFSVPTSRLVQRHQVNLGKVSEQHRNGETKTNLFKRRHESEPSDHSDITINKNDENKPWEHHRTGETRTNIFRRRRESERSDLSDITIKNDESVNIKIEEKPKRRPKSVEFAFEVISDSETTTTKKPTKDKKKGKPIRTESAKMKTKKNFVSHEILPKREEFKIETVQDEEVYVKKQEELIEAKSDDWFGFDEIISSDEEAEIQNRFVKLDIDVNDSFS